MSSVTNVVGEKLTAPEAKAIAKEAFLWGMHPVAIDHMRSSTTQNEKSPAYVGINRLHWDLTPMKAVSRIAARSNATTHDGLAATLPHRCERHLGMRQSEIEVVS